RRLSLPFSACFDPDTPKYFCGFRSIAFIELPGVRLAFPTRGERLDIRPPQLCPFVASASHTISGEFFVPFFVLVMDHEHKESSAATEISRKSRGLLTELRIRRRFMPMNPTPTIPI